MNRYLVLYNGVSAALWTYVLGRAFQDAYGYLTNNQQSFYGKSMPLAVMEALLSHTPPHHFLVLLQFFNAVFETGHTVLGLVPSPLTTVLLQFAARLFITHGITLTLPYAPGNFHPAYLGLSFSWAITEVTRYSYYVVKLVNGHAPRWFTWLRYSLFIVLYPMGLVCEATVVYSSLVVALDNYYWFLVFGLTMYVPGFLSLYSYMWRQRRKILGAYNSISASLWTIVLFNTIFLGASLGQPLLFDKTNKITTAIQTLAVVEIYNSLVGNVKSPLFTTTTQVFSRLLIVWGICQALPNSPANSHWCYITLSLSWSITEIIRYSYYATNLAGPVPQWLTWLRYTTFYVLYPTGVSSEISMIYLSLNEASAVLGDWYKWTLIAIICTYPPGFYMLYTYMIKQRKKVLGTKKKLQ